MIFGGIFKGTCMSYGLQAKYIAFHFQQYVSNFGCGLVRKMSSKERMCSLSMHIFVGTLILCARMLKRCIAACCSNTNSDDVSLFAYIPKGPRSLSPVD